MRVSGHGLQREGRAHDDAGNYTGAKMGRALCECGELSPSVLTTAKRQRWHVWHKGQVLTERERLNREAAERFLDA